MKQRSLCFAVFVWFFIMGIGCQSSTNPQPVDIYPEEDVCETCRMLITDQRFAAEFITSKGRVKKFDDPICMIKYFDLARKLQIDVAPKDVVSYFVKDYFDRKWINAKDATFVKANIVTVMGYGIACFRDHATAATFANEHKGKLHVFDDLWGLYKEANLVSRVVIKNGEMMPHLVKANFNDIVEIIAETEDSRVYHLTISGYEDVVAFDAIKKGHPRQVRFTAERPGRDFAFIDKDTGKALGKFWVEGGHFREEEKKL